MSTDSKLKKNIWKLVLLTAAGSLIYGLPYFRSYYYDAYLDVYNLSNTQMGNLRCNFLSIRRRISRHHISEKAIVCFDGLIWLSRSVAPVES